MERVMTRSMMKSSTDKIKSSDELDELFKEKRMDAKRANILDFINLDTEDLDVCVTTVPGIDEMHQNILEKEGIKTVYGLVNVLFDFEDGEECEKFEIWLKDLGINSHRDTIAKCIYAKWYILVRYEEIMSENEDTDDEEVKVKVEDVEQVEEVKYDPVKVKVEPVEDSPLKVEPVYKSEPVYKMVDENSISYHMARAIFAAGVLFSLSSF